MRGFCPLVHMKEGRKKKGGERTTGEWGEALRLSCSSGWIAISSCVLVRTKVLQVFELGVELS